MWETLLTTVVDWHQLWADCLDELLECLCSGRLVVFALCFVQVILGLLLLTKGNTDES
jgi:hypothetical protein